MKKLLKNPNGFTLVELMVVVAIIGILSAIAVPNFKKYQAKSKQSEAKIQLAAIYNAQVGTLADYDTYATCLPRMGYEQTPRGYYGVGFLNAVSMIAKFPLCAAGGTVAAGSNAQNSLDASVIFPGPTSAADHLAVAGAKITGLTRASTAAETTFTAAAEGNISSAVARDVWQITETKALTNPTPGY